MQRNVLKNCKMFIVLIVDTSERMPAPKMNRPESELLCSNTATKAKLFYPFISNRTAHMQQSQVMPLEMLVNLRQRTTLIFNGMNWFVQYFDSMWWFDLHWIRSFALTDRYWSTFEKSLRGQWGKFDFIILTVRYFINSFAIIITGSWYSQIQWIG